jgi:thiamine kinase-like enzyme
VFIDWDGSSPSTRLWDLAYAASAFTLNDPHCPPAQAAERLAAFVAGYRADEGVRADLSAVMTARVAAMYELLRSSHTDGIEPWATMYVSGHGEHWLAVLQYIQTNERMWERAMADARP